MLSVPVVADQARDEELGADRVGFGEAESVVHEQGVADGLVDHAVQDMG